MNIIELRDITFSYGEDETPVFVDYNLSIQKGKCVVFEGDNGSGKTTLFRILNGLSFPGKGSFIFGGEEINKKYLKDNKKSKIFHKKIGFLFQNPDVMLFNATVFDEIAFGPRQMGMSDEDVKARVEDCMQLFDLQSLSGKAPYHLSGGQKKKVALAAVMALNPEVLILDEPFAGLDGGSQELLMSFLIDLKAAGKTILIATHDDEIKDKLADELITLGE